MQGRFNEFRLVFVVIAMALVIGCLGSGAIAWASSTGNSSEGEKVYQTNCQNCHGNQGRGDGALAGDLTPPPADLSSQRVQSQYDQEILETIRNGRPGTSMPSWKEDLSEEQLHDVLAFIRQLSPS